MVSIRAHRSWCPVPRYHRLSKQWRQSQYNWSISPVLSTLEAASLPIRPTLRDPASRSYSLKNIHCVSALVYQLPHFKMAHIPRCHWKYFSSAYNWYTIITCRHVQTVHYMLHEIHCNWFLTSSTAFFHYTLLAYRSCCSPLLISFMNEKEI